MKVKVSAYSGYKANEKPTSFVLGDHSYQVEEILDQWYGPEATYFKVRANDHNVYILKYDSVAEEWSLESFRQAPAP